MITVAMCCTLCGATLCHTGRLALKAKGNSQAYRTAALDVGKFKCENFEFKALNLERVQRAFG